MRALIHSALLLSLVAASSSLSAQFSVSGGLIGALDSLKKATHASLAYTVGADYNGHLPGTEIQARTGLAFALMPGQAHNGLTTSLNLAQLHGDLFVPTGVKPLRAVVGLSLNHYGMSLKGTENTADPLDRDHHFPIRDASGIKFGFRFGLDYALSSHMSLELLYQQTELAGKDLNDPLVRQGGINPGWLQVVFTYRF